MPNLFELKSLENLKYVHKQYMKVIDSHRKPQYWKHYPCPICKTYSSSCRVDKISIDGLYYFPCPKCHSIYNAMQLVIPMDSLYDCYRDKLVKPSASLRGQLGLIKYQQVQAYFKGEGKLLDVGCGSGQLLDIFKEHGWCVLGIDPCVNIKYEDYYTNETFDCISFFGVLEHVNNPICLLRKAIGMLKPNGLIVIEVPSADCLLMQYLKDNPFSPYRFIEHCRHLSFFSRYAIDWVCGKLNLEVVELKSVGFDLQTITLSDNKDLIAIQAIVDKMLLGDHYRVFLKWRD